MSDLISRQDAIDAILGITTMRNTIPLDSAIFNIKKLPSAQKKGEWIPVTNGRGGHECNLCHNYAPSYRTGDDWLTDFCPNCGADMRGENNGKQD